MKTTRILAPAAMIAAALALTGCSLGVTGPTSGTNSAGSTAPTPGTSSSPKGGTGGTSVDDAGSGPFPCNVFSVAYIEKISGYDIVKAMPITAVGSANHKSCEYEGTGGHSIGIQTAPGEGAAGLQVFSQIEDTGGPVTGIGDSAWGNDSELAVVFGSDYVDVTDDSDVDDESAKLADISLDTLKQMVLKVHAAMSSS